MNFSDKDIDWEAWYNQNKGVIPDEYKADFEDNIVLLQFLFSVYFKIMQRLSPELKQLMFSQFPVIESERRPVVVEFIDKFIHSVGTKMLFKLNGLIEGQKNGVNIREKYHQFDQWLILYGRPPKLKQIEDSDRTRARYKKMSNSQWETYKSVKNEQLLLFFNWKERRKTEFINILQNILFEDYKDLEDLNADELIIYAVIIYEEYNYYLMVCERIELFIDCGFPEEEIYLSDQAFLEKYEKLNPEIKANAVKLRHRRIAGEKI
ncbi:MAG: hypothetical protein P1P88_00825 [Bacteroidales bacterium]|nr:hypothetical protein [Bacteroidales bacterium]